MNTSAEHYKFLVTAFFSSLSALLGVLYIPVLLMISCNIMDYVTGLMAAKYRGGISSYVSMRGIFKKVSMWMLVIVGSIVDQLITYASDMIGFESPFTFLVSSIVAIWIICNEIISILENMVDIGISIPPFLLPLVKNLKAYAEKQTTIDEVKKDGPDEK